MTSRRRASRPTGVRLLLAAAVAASLVVLFLVGYAAAARTLLSGPKLRSLINVHPELTSLDWDEAHSKWPGRLLVKNLRIRGSDRNVQWIITVPEARVRFSVLALASRTFRTYAVDASAISFRLRQKLRPREARPSVVERLPPIPGFADPPLREERAPSPSPANPWTVSINGISTSRLEELWIEGWRYRGLSSLRGRFFLTPGRYARIGPASIDFERGVLRFGETPVFSALKGRIEASFDDWDPRVTKADAVWEVVTAKISLEGPTESAAFLDEVMPLGERVRLERGPGRLSVEGEIERGQARGEARLIAKNGRYLRPGLALDGDADARLKISGWKLYGGRPAIGGSSLSVANVFAEGGERTRGWWGDFTVESGRLDGGFSGRVGLRCSDGRPLLAFLGAKLPAWTDGLVRLEDLGAVADLALSPARTTVRRLAAKGGPFEIEGEYDRRGESSQGAFLIETGVLRVGVGLKNGKSSLRLFGPRAWFEKRRDLVASAER